MVDISAADTLTALRPSGRLDALRGAVFEIALCSWSMLYGVLVLVDVLHEELHPIGALSTLVPAFTLALSAIFLAGGTVVAASFLCRRMNLGELMTMERVGLALLGGAWTGYGLGVLLTDPADIAAWTSAGFVLASLVVRSLVVAREAQLIRDGQRYRREATS